MELSICNERIDRSGKSARAEKAFWSSQRFLDLEIIGTIKVSLRRGYSLVLYHLLLRKLMPETTNLRRE
jgi:hypothetical protein